MLLNPRALPYICDISLSLINVINKTHVVQVVLGINLTHVGRKVVYFFFLWVRIIKDVIEVLWRVPFFFARDS